MRPASLRAGPSETIPRTQGRWDSYGGGSDAGGSLQQFPFGFGRFPVSSVTPTRLPTRQRWGRIKRDTPRMREVIFRVVSECPGQLEAQAETFPIRIAAPSLEELQHEAREALIHHLGEAHCTYRVRVRRCQISAVSAIRPLRPQPATCC